MNQRATSVIAQHPYISGAVLLVVSLPVLALLPKAQSQQVAAVLLAAIAGAYWGFAASDGRVSANLIEGIVAFGFCGLALAGLWSNPLFIIAGYFAHGLWDLLHHRPGPQATIPGWWVPLCVLYDWVAGAFLLVWWSL